MLEAVTSCEKSRPTLHYSRRTAANREEIAGCFVGLLGRAPRHRSSTPLESRSVSELRILGVAKDPAPETPRPGTLRPAIRRSSRKPVLGLLYSLVGRTYRSPLVAAVTGKCSH